MHRLLPILYALTLLSSGRATAQITQVTWPALSGASRSPLYFLPPAGRLTPRPISAERTDTVVRQIKPTYWKEGGTIGALAAGSFLAYIGYALCTSGDGNQDSCGKAFVGGALIGGGMGFGLGALVGGQFPKHPKKVPVDSAQFR